MFTEIDLQFHHHHTRLCLIVLPFQSLLLQMNQFRISIVDDNFETGLLEQNFGNCCRTVFRATHHPLVIIYTQLLLQLRYQVRNVFLGAQHIRTMQRLVIFHQPGQVAIPVFMQLRVIQQKL